MLFYVVKFVIKANDSIKKRAVRIILRMFSRICHTTFSALGVQ